MRVIAIVDSRNMRGLAQSLLGITRNPTPTGLEICLGRFGFELDRAFFSVALPRERDRSTLRRQLDENTRYIESVQQDARVSILSGELHQHQGGRIEEKLVDVLCAVETVRQAKHIADSNVATSADAVLVLSQDADLAPGIELAQEFDVPVLTLAPGKVHRRGHPFIVLTEPALADLTEVKPPFGQALRRKVAEKAIQPSVDSWEYRYESPVPRLGPMAWMHHRHGIRGACDPALVSNAKRGELFNLAPIGVLPAQGNEFPILKLGPAPNRAADLISGVVIGRFRLFEVTVDIGNGKQARAYVPNSHLTPGTPILLQARAGDHRERFRYIGALDDPQPLLGCGGVAMEAVSVIVEVVRHAKQHAIGACALPEIDVFMPGAAKNTMIGKRYLVSLAGSGRHPESPFVGHVASSLLPG